MTTEPNSIAVVGPGSIGAYVAAQLAAAGLPVTSCARRPFDTYVVESPIAPVNCAAHVVTDPAAVEPHDWVIVAVKTTQTLAASPWLDRLIGPSTTVVAMQNGVEHAERFATLAHGAEVIPCAVYCSAELLAPGHVVHKNSTVFQISDSPAARRFAALCTSPGIEVRNHADLHARLWRKLAGNLVANGLTAITGQPIGVLHRPGMAGAVGAILHEWAEVARAEGAPVTQAEIDKLLHGIATNDPTIRPSMLQDREASRPTEFDALYGAVVRAGRRHGIATPAHDVMMGLLDALEPTPT